MNTKYLTFAFLILSLSYSCKKSQVQENNFLAPIEIIDLGTIITEDLPYEFWGKEMMDALGFEKPNHFDVREWELNFESGLVSGSNAYYTLFNHGGPHIDAPNHVGLGKGLDSYSSEQFVGPVKVFEVANYPNGRTIPIDVFK